MGIRHERYKRFEVIRELGRGAFCRTLLVKDQERRNRTFALKVPLTSETEESIVRELMNAGALRALSHPNIVKCFDFAKYDGFYAMLLEYVDGCDLRAIVGPFDVERRPMPLDRGLEIFQHVCHGLAAAHRASLIHSDIKPENILVRQEDGLAKITDLGVSRIKTSTMTAGNSVAGTLPYMAPEVFRGQMGVPSDIWSLSVTLYEMVTGRLPFLADNAFALQELILRAQPIPPRRLNPQIGEPLEAAILRGLDKDPHRRFTTAEEMIEAAQSPTGRPDPTLEAQIDAARQLLREGREAEAEERARDLAARHPTVPSAHLLLAGIYSARLEYGKTEETLRAGIGRCPKDARLHFVLAPALWQQGGAKKQGAIAALHASLSLGLSGKQASQARALLATWEREDLP
jgi:serine/threonine protein kinase